MVDLILESDTQLVTVNDSDPTVSVLWDRAVQQAVINTNPGPTIASRAYSMTHTAIFDAWATYDPVAIATTYGDKGQRPIAENTAVNKQKAMSHAAYEVLRDLFPGEITLFDEVMSDLDYSLSGVSSKDMSTPEGIGSFAANALLEFRYDDGSNQLGTDIAGIAGVPYSDTKDYKYLNHDTESMVSLSRWTPEDLSLTDEPELHQFLTPHWGDVATFAPESSNLLPESPEPFLLVEGETDLAAKTITLADDTVFKIDRSLIGKIINPEFIAQAEQVIDYSSDLSDEQKLIAEFWEDADGTSNPPGTWMTFGAYVSARDNHSLDEDAQLFSTLGNAVSDAGIASWKAKYHYDYARPVRTIRALGELGLIGEYNESLGGYAIEAWQPNLGTQTILARDFVTYQTPNGDPSPPFAEYISGHSPFSAAGAEILKLTTGSDKFGGEVTFAPGSSRFEPDNTPVELVTLKWDTFSEAANEAGISRLYGGIHFEDGDLNGRLLGQEIGELVYEQAQFYINGGEKEQPDNYDFVPLDNLLLFTNVRQRLSAIIEKRRSLLHTILPIQSRI